MRLFHGKLFDSWKDFGRVATLKTMKRQLPNCLPLAGLILTIAGHALAADAHLIALGRAWAANSVNCAVYRNDPITTHDQRRYAAYYDRDGRVIIASHSLAHPDVATVVTPFSGDVKDAHNVISIIADGDGFLHLSWDHHGH